MLTFLGLALVVPNVLSAAMLVAFVVALEIQVRLVEEPYLRRVHGDAYRELRGPDRPLRAVDRP